MSEQTTLRDTLAANFAAAEAGTLESVNEAPVENEVPDTTDALTERQRDEAGRFAKKQDEIANTVAVPLQPEAIAAPKVTRPTTWKQEYMPLWDKLVSGAPLTPEEALKVAEYSNQRESEYKSGVSTYKAEADQSKELRQAFQEFVPDLQKFNLQPAAWIQMVGKAHQTLATGTPEQKLQMFSKMAQDYGIPLQAIHQTSQGESVDPNLTALMSHLDQLSNKVNAVSSWREQQEQAEIQKEISRFSDPVKYPYFEQVRGDMAQLLESGMAKDIETAYQKAVRFNDDAWTAEQQRNTSQAQKSIAVAKAKSNAISPRSSTPSGIVANAGDKDRRALIAEGVRSAMNTNF